MLPPGATEQLAAAAALRKTPPSALPAHLAATKAVVQPQVRVAFRIFNKFVFIYYTKYFYLF